MAGMERKHCFGVLSGRVLGVVSSPTDHCEKVSSTSSDVSILGHDGYGQACRDKDEYGLETVCYDLAFLDIRLWYPHLVVCVGCGCWKLVQRSVAGTIAVALARRGRGGQAVNTADCKHNRTK